MLYPASLTLDFYIQATSHEEAKARMNAIVATADFSQPEFDFPEIEQMEIGEYFVTEPSE
ncbi:MAG: hypothetical protein LBM08_00740 [Dysgonamonadaceae bacterium]|jgi:hypothetical protein|nr:hypothetical protein [Dysgonamonadaceae bacterium]